MVLGGRGYRLTAFFEENSFYILSKYLRVLYVADFCGIFNKKISITLSSEVRFFFNMAFPRFFATAPL